MQNIFKITVAFFLVVLLAACGGSKKKELTQIEQAQFNSHIEAAKREHHLNHFAAADKELVEALKLVPDNPELWRDLARVRVQNNDLAGAEKALVQVAKLNPANDDVWFDLGITRARLKDKSGARDAFKKCISACEDAYKKNATTPLYLTKQVRPLILLGRADDARAVLAKAAKLFPENNEIKQLIDAKIVDQFLAAPDYKELAVN